MADDREALVADLAEAHAQINRVRAVAARYREYRGGFDQIRQERAEMADVIQAALDGADELRRVAPSVHAAIQVAAVPASDTLGADK